jgi:branched-chain amino acid transport system substrate-binding protein
MASQGYRPTILASFTLADPLMFTLAGDLWEGVYVNVAGQVGPLTTPEAVRAIDILSKYEPRLKSKEYAGLYGAVSMMLTIEGLKRAGRDLTREKFVSALESLRDFRSRVLAFPVTFTPENHMAGRGLHVFKVVDGKEVSVMEGYWPGTERAEKPAK